MIADLRGAIGESRPSDFDARRALRSLGSGFLISGGRSLAQLTRTRNSIVDEINPILEAIAKFGLDPFNTPAIIDLPEFKGTEATVLPSSDPLKNPEQESVGATTTDLPPGFVVQP